MAAHRLRPLHWFVLTVALATQTLVLHAAWRPLRDGDPQLILDENLNGLSDRPLQSAPVSIDGSPVFVVDGIALEPGRRAAATFVLHDVPRQRDRFLRMLLWLYRPPGTTNAVECSMDAGKTFRTVASNLEGTPAIVTASDCEARDGVIVRIQASAVSEPGSALHLMIDKVQFFTLTEPPSAPDLIVVTSAGVLMLLAVCVVASFGGGWRSTALIAAVAIATVATAYARRPDVFAPQDPILGFSIATLTAAALLAVIVAARASRRLIEALAVVLLLVVAFQVRWQALESSQLKLLSPDAKTVGVIAARMSSPYDTDIREPAWPWGVYLSQRVMGETPSAVKAFSLVTGMIALVAAYVFARLYFERPLAAIGVLLLLVDHGALVESSVAGHRTELFTLALLVIACCAFPEGLQRRTRAVGLAAGTSLAVLTQLTAAIPAGATLAWCAWKHRIRWRDAAVAAGLAAVLITPHAVDNHRKLGQAFYFSRTAVPTFYRNYEFMLVRHAGCDGCPTPAQMAASSYSGRHATMFEYLFTLHRPSEVVRDLLHGYADVFVLPSVHLRSILGPDRPLILYWFYLGGFAIALVSKRRVLLIIPLVSLNLLAFVIGVMSIDDRLLLYLAPFAAMLTVLPIDELSRRMTPRLRSRIERAHVAAETEL